MNGPASGFLELRNVRKAFGDRVVLADVDLDVARQTWSA